MDRAGPRAVVALALATLVGALAWVLTRARESARSVPISPVTADWFVGPDFVERRGLTAGETVAGELDDLDILAGDGFDPAALDPAVRRFYERTGEYHLRYRATWHVPFRTGAALATRLTRHIEQLNLPAPSDEAWHELESRFLAVSEPPDPSQPEATPNREDVRAWVRTDPETGDAVFVALYATHECDGQQLVNIAAPLPGGNVSTVLRPAHLDGPSDGSGATGIRLTTEGDGDPGLYLRTPIGPLEVPAGQEFRVWRHAEADGGKAEGAVGGDDGTDTTPTLGAVHEMWLFGRRFLTVDYEIRRVEAASGGGSQTSSSTS